MQSVSTILVQERVDNPIGVVGGGLMRGGGNPFREDTWRRHWVIPGESSGPWGTLYQFQLDRSTEKLRSCKNMHFILDLGRKAHFHLKWLDRC